MEGTCVLFDVISSPHNSSTFPVSFFKLFFFIHWHILLLVVCPTESEKDKQLATNNKIMFLVSFHVSLLRYKKKNGRGGLFDAEERQSIAFIRPSNEEAIYGKSVGNTRQ